ncbi:hypothetical protein FXN65_02080 [Metapseudomonas lalkuanensis]|uniref:Uncharacterized protein n=1 Tax=Metapseudomonas lalkuanensis TaxID=2604832 RepID=A0A5J6QF04_9GAMM|nr:hypothetical protein [Pseudomonas lalkuanensis]QEY60893.1 hypothetical protein FXN65_02080 [Pseudomonas lalkuanensis]UCO98628.1 hypothetical protein LF844_02070 [Pseudomonas lalkuanensis]
MRYPNLIALFVPMLIGLPAAAGEWPTGEREHFIQECKTSAQANVPVDKLQRYCSCAADGVSSEFSGAELEALKAQKTPLPEQTHQRLIKVSQSCLSQLNG